ncbi:hypothetical protein T439DRAFT_378200 [Meredithblackwellia eburnea MCA 4105]
MITSTSSPAKLFTGIVLVATALSSTDAASTSQTAVVSPTIPPTAFFWATTNNSLLALPQCSSVHILAIQNSLSTATAIPPYYFTVIPDGLVPSVQASLNRLFSFDWVPNLPIGTQFSLAMTDSANNSGGIVGGYSIIAGNSSCPSSLATNSTTISFTVDPPNNPCDEINIDVKGGAKPYTVSVVAPALGRYANATGFSTNSFTLGNIITAGEEFKLFITDSNGVSSTVSAGMTSALGQSSCQKPGSFNGSSNIGAIVGGVVGGVLIFLAIVILFYWYFRKIQREKAEEAHRQELNSADYQLPDGTAPKVTPFVLPPRVAEGEGGWPDTSKYLMIKMGDTHLQGVDEEPLSTTYDKPPCTKTNAPPSYGNPNFGQNPEVRQSDDAPLSGPLTSTLPQKYNRSGAGGGGSERGWIYSSSADEVSSELDPSRDARTGLANPDDFEYRTGRR